MYTYLHIKMYLLLRKNVHISTCKCTCIYIDTFSLILKVRSKNQIFLLTFFEVM